MELSVWLVSEVSPSACSFGTLRFRCVMLMVRLLCCSEREILQQLQDEAQAKHIGMWAKNVDPKSTVRNVEHDVNARALVDKHKDRPIPGGFTFAIC